MKTNFCKTIGQITITCFALLALGLPQQVRAQFTGNNQTNIISGVTSNWPGVYYVGSNYVFDALFIKNGGALSNGFAQIGSNVGANSNKVLVSGSGSVWTNLSVVIGANGAGNTLVISNGGLVVNSFSNAASIIGFGTDANNNTALVTGLGSVLYNASILEVGSSGARNNLVISNGGTVFSSGGHLAYGPSSSNNSVRVIGSGSIWSNDQYLRIGTAGSGNSVVISDGGSVVVNDNGFQTLRGLYVGASGKSNSLVISDGGKLSSASCTVGRSGSGSNSVLVTGLGSTWNNVKDLNVGYRVNGNTLTIANGGSVTTSNAYVGFDTGADTNRISVSGGSLCVTHILEVRRGTLTFDSGTISADTLLLTNDAASVIAFKGGTLHSKSTSVTNTQPFVVGNGANTTTFHLVGGVHSFNNGLRIRANSLLTGCGTINAKVIIDPGGAVHASCTNLVFNSSVTNNGAMVVDGAVLEIFGTFVNNGRIFVLNGGATNFHGTFVNNGEILNGDIHLNIARDDTDGLLVSYTGAPDVTYRLQRAASVTGTWTNLATNTAPASGLIEYHDTSPLPGQAFYRAVQP